MEVWPPFRPNFFETYSVENLDDDEFGRRFMELLKMLDCMQRPKNEAKHSGRMPSARETSFR